MGVEVGVDKFVLAMKIGKVNDGYLGNENTLACKTSWTPGHEQ